MDVARVAPRRSIVARTMFVVASTLGLAAFGVWALPGLFAHAAANEPVAARDSLVIDTVRRGTFERSVTAAGIFVPDRVRIVASAADGTVAELSVRPGSHVDAGSTIARLDNPDLRVAVADAQAQLAAAVAEIRSARAEGVAARLDEDAVLRSARAEDSRAGAEARSDEQLHAKGLIADLQYSAAAIKSSEDRDLVAIARSKIDAGGADNAAKIAAAQARADEIAAELEARRAQLQTLVISAGAAGIVQSVAVDAGQRVTSGTEFARIADERDLKAVVQVPEGDVRGVVPGLRATIVSGESVTATGRVARIAPAAQNGTVAVDVVLDRLPPGARSEQNVDGTIVVDRIANALSVERPAAAVDGARIALYRLDASGTHAYRAAVALGEGSDERARIVSGLAAGDRIIVSDTSGYSAPMLRIQP